MKRVAVIFLFLAILISCAACSGNNSKSNTIEPKVSQMKAICELAVMECYYHNVAKYFEKDAESGFLGIGKKDKHFWIEYSGVVRLGIDTSLVSISVDDTVVTVTLPEAKILGCKVDSSTLSKDSFIVDKDSAEVTAQDEIKALEEAQKHLESTAASDTALLANAQQRAEALLEDYILNISEAVGKQYSIKWEYPKSQNFIDSLDNTEEITESVE